MSFTPCCLWTRWVLSFSEIVGESTRCVFVGSGKMNKKWHQFNVVGKRTLLDKGRGRVKVSFGLAHVKTLQLMSPPHLCLDFSLCDWSKLVKRTSEDFPGPVVTEDVTYELKTLATSHTHAHWSGGTSQQTGGKGPRHISTPPQWTPVSWWAVRKRREAVERLCNVSANAAV